MIKISLSYVIAAFFFALILTGCAAEKVQSDAARVTALSPNPMVDLPGSPDAISLEIDPAVKDAFVVPEQSGITSVPVEDWYQSLRAGFMNGPARFFSRGTSAQAKVWKLVILRTDLDYVPTAMYANRVRLSGAATAVARLRYMTRFVSPDGRIVSRTQGEVISNSQWTAAGGSSTTASEVLAKMYEAISLGMASAN